jgi:thiol-disulfide isomerase/thioredoxin
MEYKRVNFDYKRFRSKAPSAARLSPGPLVFPVVILFISLFCGPSYGQTKPVGFSIPFPNLTFQQALSREEKAYLGIPRKTTFSFKEIRGSLILVEFLSVYCVSCQRQAPIFNELYSSIEENPKLKGKVKMIGIAAGNSLPEVGIFKRHYKVPYPIFGDPEFNAHTEVGSPRTPFTIWVRRDALGNSIVVSTHLGLIDSMKTAREETRAVLQYDLALLKPKKGSIYEGDALKPPLTEEELVEKARQGMEASGGKVLQIEKISLRDGDWIYIGKVDLGTYQKSLFSKLASRRAVCDICHDTFFIYTFDTEGKVIDILPIQLTKIGNLDWTEQDIEKLRSRTIGRSIFRRLTFDPSIDSISGATITAALVFDSLDKAKEIYEKLKKEGYIQK